MPMSYSDAEQKITERFKQNAPAGLKIAYDNLDDREIRENRQLAQWVRFTLLDAGTRQIGMGSTSTRNRVQGIVSVQCFGRSNIWTKTILDLADLIVVIFRDVQHDGVTYRAPDVVKIGPTGGWYQVNVVAPFYWDYDA